MQEGLLAVTNDMMGLVITRQKTAVSLGGRIAIWEKGWWIYPCSMSDMVVDAVG